MRGSSFLYHQGQSRKAVAGLFTSGSESKNSFAACTVLSVAPLLWGIAIYPAYSAEARQDLRDIYEYIAYELLVPETAAGQWLHCSER